MSAPLSSSTSQHDKNRGNQQGLQNQDQQDPRHRLYPAQQRHHSFDSSATQQLLFQAYVHAIRTGQIPMPSISPAPVAKAHSYVSHSRTISDAKKGVTYVGQDQLKKLPIPNLDETCQRYLESVRPFLVGSSWRCDVDR